MKGSINFGIVFFVLSIFVLGYSFMIVQNAPTTQDPTTEKPTIEKIDFSDFENTNSISDAKSFESTEEFTKFLSEYTDSYAYYGYGITRALSSNMAMEESAVAMDIAGSADSLKTTASAPQAMADSDDGGSIDYSGTNVQVESVDEADIIKTDGNYIYTITDNYLYIIRSLPAEESEVIYQTKLDQYPQGLFIEDDRMMIIGNVNDYSKLKNKDYRPQNGLTYVYTYNIEDKENPEIIKEQYYEGYYNDARLKNGIAYVITNMGTTFSTDYPTPVMMEGAEIRSIAVDDIYYYPIPYNSPRLTGIQSIDIKTGDMKDQKVITTDYRTEVYMSDNAIYLTSEERINEYEIQQEIIKELLKPYLTESDLALIEKIENTDSDILNTYEKQSKITQIYYTAMQYMSEDEQVELEEKAEELTKKKMEEYDYDTYTVIHKIEAKSGNLELTATQKVPGTINNQFSMDEKDNVLRIATTISPGWWFRQNKEIEQESHVYTLDSNLKIMDKITGLGIDESIYSTRFIGDRLYLVTFRQTDPFYVIDLSDPDNIEELGELKITGYSTYLHPYDENKIIGIGREATETGRTQGLKISLYDVTDPSNPIELSKYVTESRSAYSSAEYEHKAVLFSKDKNLLVIPAYSYTYSYGSDDEGYNGAMVFKITEDEITLRGLIDHSEGITTKYYYYGATVERSLYIEDNLYTKSPNLLRINALDDLESIKSIKLEKGTESGDIPIY